MYLLPHDGSGVGRTVSTSCTSDISCSDFEFLLFLQQPTASQEAFFLTHACRFGSCDLGRTRTCNLFLRREVLNPVELQDPVLTLISLPIILPVVIVPGINTALEPTTSPDFPLRSPSPDSEDCPLEIVDAEEVPRRLSCSPNPMTSEFFWLY